VPQCPIAGDANCSSCSVKGARPHTPDCMTSWVVLRHPVNGYLGWFLEGGRSFVVKVDVNRNRILADENTRNLYTSVQVATAKTVFTTSNIYRILVCKLHITN